MAAPDIIIVVSGGNVQAVYAAPQTRIQMIDFDNLRAGDPFDPDDATEPNGPPDGPAARDVIAEAVALADHSRAALADAAPDPHPAQQRYYVEDDDGRHYGPFDERDTAADVADAIHGRIITPPVGDRPDAEPG